MPLKREIVLASASPRRKELLEKIGLPFKIEPSDYPEHLEENVKPEELVTTISQGKACAVAAKYANALIIAADTLGVVQGRVVGKPQTALEAAQILRLLSGKSHRVITGLTVLDSFSQKLVTKIIETRVYFKNLSAAEIAAYVNTGEPLDKAGAYAIQGLGSLFVEKIQGDYYNVMGLPLNALANILSEFGVNLLDRDQK